MTTPFLYDPEAGNLVLDFQESSDSGQAIDYDGLPVGGSPVVRVLLNTDSGTTASGFFIKSHITQLTFEPLPMGTIRTSQVEVCWNSLTNLSYQVQYRSSLTENLWTALGNCVQGSGTRMCIYDPIVVGQPQRFYRVVRL